MTRYAFPDAGSQLVFAPTGYGHPLRSATGGVVQLFLDAGLTVPATDLQTLAGVPLGTNKLTVNADSLLPDFLGPDGVDTLWTAGAHGATPVRSAAAAVASAVTAVGDGRYLRAQVAPPTTSTSVTLTAGQITPISAAVGNVTATLPTPSVGVFVGAKKTDSSTNTITISGHINNTPSSTITLRIPEQVKGFISNGTTWWAVFGDLSLTQLDSRFAVNTAAELRMFVTPRGSDSNDGLTLKTAKLTVSAALTAGAKHVTLGTGTISVGAQIDVVVAGTTIEGPGSNSCVLSATTSMTSILRVAAARCIMRGFRISSTAGTQTYGLNADINSPGSNQSSSFYDIEVNGAGGGTINYCLTVGGAISGSPNDVSEQSFFGCRFQGASGQSDSSAVLLGNGSANNILNSRFYGCWAGSSVYGLYLNGSGVAWEGGTIQTNSGVSIKLGAIGTGPITIRGVRDEGSAKLWECLTNGTAARVISIADYQFVGSTSSDGKVIDHECSHILKLRNVALINPITANGYVYASSPSSNPGLVDIDGLVTPNTTPVVKVNSQVTTKNVRLVDGTGKLVAMPGYPDLDPAALYPGNWQASDFNMIGWVSESAPLSTGLLLPNTGVMYGSLIKVAKSGTIGTVAFYLSGIGNTLTNAYLAVYKGTTQLGVSADISATLSGTTGFKTVTVTTTTALSVGDTVSVFLLVGSATTKPTLYRSYSPASNALANPGPGTAPNRFQSSGSGLTAAPSTLGTTAADTSCYWFGVW